MHVAHMWEKEYADRALVGEKMERHLLQVHVGIIQ
jgi:hypothetical protein